MINDIITAFEQKFNKFADSTEAFTTWFVRDEDSAIGTLCFNRFNVEFEYCLECGALTEKSGLNIIIDFTKRSNIPLKGMMYDFIDLIDGNNFNCWFYCYIENAQRMELCFDRLAQDFSEVFPKLKAFAESDENVEVFRRRIRSNILKATKIDLDKDIQDAISSELDDDPEYGVGINVDEVYDYLFSLYFGVEMSAFATEEYKCFLGGNYKRALKLYLKKKNRFEYESRLIEFMQSCDNPQTISSVAHECLRDGLKQYYGASEFLPVFVSWLLLCVPLFAVSVAIYYAISFLLYHSAIYASQFELYNSLYCFLPAFICSIAGSYFLHIPISRRIFKSRYKRIKDYDSILNTKKSKKRMSILLYAVYLVAIMTVFMNASSGISLYERGLKVNTHYFDVIDNYYSYDEVSCLSIENAGFGTEYTLRFDGEESVDISMYADYDDIEKNIIPVLESRGIEIFRNTE